MGCISQPDGPIIRSLDVLILLATNVCEDNVSADSLLALTMLSIRSTGSLFEASYANLVITLLLAIEPVTCAMFLGHRNEEEDAERAQNC